VDEQGHGEMSAMHVLYASKSIVEGYGTSSLYLPRYKG
jgi:hypothetical protein